MKRFTAFVFALCMLLTAVPGRGEQNIEVLLNGEAISFDQAPIIENDRVLVPARAIFEALGARVEWDGETRTAAAEKDGRQILLTVGNREITVDGNKTPLEAPPKILNDRMLVPLRAVSESIEADVIWNQESRTVLIITWDKFKADESKTYLITNAYTGKALAYKNNDIVTEHICRRVNQLWNISDDGVIAPASGEGKIGLYKSRLISADEGEGFMLYQNGEEIEIITQSGLIIEEAAGRPAASSRYTSELCKWRIEEVSAADTEDTSVYYSLRLKETYSALTFSGEGGLVLRKYDGGDEQKWLIAHTISGNYIISAKLPVQTEKAVEIRSIDVSGASKEEGASVIIYKTGGGANQRWSFEKQNDGSYLIKSESSGLYLTESQGRFTQEKYGNGNQNWILEAER